MRNLEEKALSLSDQARSIKIYNQESLSVAGETIKGFVALRKEVVSHHAPMKQAGYDAWQAAISAEKKLLSPISEAERLLKSAVGAYILEEQRRRTAEAERLLREQEEQIEAEIVAAEKEGEVYVETFMPLPVMAAPPMPTGISTQERWYAEVVSIRKLAGAVWADSQYPEDLLIGLDRDSDGRVSGPALNKMASALKSALSIPGVKPYSKLGVSARAK